MSLILLLNGLINILMCVAFFYYVHRYRSLLNKTKVMMYSSFGLYFLFVGFLRIRIGIIDHQLVERDVYDVLYNLFNIINIITGSILVTFMYNIVTLKSNIFRKEF